MTPLYTSENCKPAFKLYWTLAVFWRDTPIPPEHWFDELKPLTEKDGVRILEYRLKDGVTSQFLLSTRPELSPSAAIRSVKGRLQYQIRKQVPKAFKENYSIKSVGSAKLDVVQHYLDTQLEHHPMADPEVQARFGKYQIDHPQVNLGFPRRSAHGEFIYNLHLVLVHAGRWREIRDGRLTISHNMIRRTAEKKKHLLSKARLLPDHIHLTLGCDVKESPMEVALGYLNNIAYGHEMKPIFQYGFYAGTFGEYDLGAIRWALGMAGNQCSAGASPAETDGPG
jgi:REP element-mobilizing transposase RayT